MGMIIPKERGGPRVFSALELHSWRGDEGGEQETRCRRPVTVMVPNSLGTRRAPDALRATDAQAR